MIEQLYRSLFPELAAWCQSLTGDRGEAEEIVQEAFLRAMAHEPDIRPLDPAQRRAWLYRTVRNIFLDRRRRAKRIAYIDPNGCEPAALSAEMAESEWLALLASLPGIEGTLFVMRYLQGFTSAQIGRFLSMPAATVRSKLASARKHIKEMLGGEF